MFGDLPLAEPSPVTIAQLLAFSLVLCYNRDGSSSKEPTVCEGGSQAST